MKIALQYVGKVIDGHTVLTDVTEEFEEGAVNVIMGTNGAGKTTLLRMVNLLDKPHKGDIFFDNRQVSGLSSSQKTQLRRRMGFVFQNPLVLEGSVLHNLTYGLKARKRNWEERDIDAMLVKVGLENKRDQEAKKLSGGEKQRLQLARVMLLDPEVLLLDEPTSNLDPLSTRNIEMLITEISKKGKTVILSTHNLVQARMLGKKFFFMKEGRVVHQGSGTDMFHQPVSLDIAEFASAENIIYGKIVNRENSKYLESNGLQIMVVTSLEEGEAAGIIRAEDILLSLEPIVSSARNSFRGTILSIEDMGIILSAAVECGKQVLISFITRESASFMGLKPGQSIIATFKSTSVHVLKLPA